MRIQNVMLLIATAALIPALGCKKKEKAISIEEQRAAEQGKREKMQMNSDDELPVVDIDVVRSGSVPQTMKYAANVQAFNSNNISPATMNRIKTINVEVGDPVAQGQVIATLDESSALQLKVNIDQLQREYDRARQLVEIGSGTQAAVDSYKAQLDAAKTQYDNLMENTILKAPIDGVVTARNYDPGDMTSTLPIVTIGQIKPAVKVIINITENDIADINTGMPVTVEFDAFEGNTFPGKVNRIYPNVDPSTRTFQAEVQVNNPTGKIRPGMFARVTLDHGAKRHVLVPDRAVVKQTGSGNRYVYVYRNGKVSYNKVEVGRQVDNAIEIISGVHDGDTVVIAGQLKLADGVPVQLKRR